MRLLDGTPFDSYTIPAWLLTVLVGGTSLLGAALVWRRSARAAHASILAGLALLGWIVTEFAMIPEAWMLQLPYFIIALAIMWLGWNLRRPDPA